MPEHVSVAVQCNLFAVPPLQRLTPSTTEPLLDDSFVAETEQKDTDADLDVSFTCSQTDYSTEYVYTYSSYVTGFVKTVLKGTLCISRNINLKY